jgi:phytoene synthase
MTRPQTSAPRPGAHATDAARHCRQVIAEHSKSFALASRVLPPLCRDRAAVVYAWCRRADDTVDEILPGQDADAQAVALLRLRAELDHVYAGRAQSDIVLSAFQQVIEECRVPVVYPITLLEGMAMDVDAVAYQTMDELRLYCYCVAGTVGLMMSHVMGLCRDSALIQAAHMGMAMQLTNICRDVVEDWNRGRLYVPDEILAEYGALDLRGALGGPFPETARAPMAAALRFLLSEAERYYRSGDQGLSALPWRCAFAVRAARLVYSAIGERIARTQHDVTAGRAVVPASQKLGLVGRAGLYAAVELPRRLGAGQLGARHQVPALIIEDPEHVLRV